MSRPSSLPVLFVGAVVTSGLFAQLAHAAPDAGILQQSINACRAIADVATRVSCYDRLATQAGAGAVMLPPAEPMGSTATSPPGQTSAGAFVPAERLSSESLRHDTHEIVLTIARISMTGNRMLSMVMDDGITWDQSEEKTIRNQPSVGDRVKISRGKYGMFGYTCKLDGRVDFFHCKPPHGLDGKLRRP